jgi:uncharacterized Zn finger protein (UPF0148 family)
MNVYQYRNCDKCGTELLKHQIYYNKKTDNWLCPVCIRESKGSGNNNNNKQKLKNLVCEIIDSDIIETAGFLDMNIYRSQYVDLNLHSSSMNEETIKTLSEVADITDIFIANGENLIVHMKPKRS